MWQAEYGDIHAQCFVWLDESGVNNETFQRRSGQVPRGQAVVLSEDFGGGEQVMMLPALCSQGIIAMDILEGGVTKERFIAFLHKHLVREIIV